MRWIGWTKNSGQRGQKARELGMRDPCTKTGDSARGKLVAYHGEIAQSTFVRYFDTVANSFDDAPAPLVHKFAECSLRDYFVSNTSSRSESLMRAVRDQFGVFGDKMVGTLQTLAADWAPPEAISSPSSTSGSCALLGEPPPSSPCVECNLLPHPPPIVPVPQPKAGVHRSIHTVDPFLAFVKDFLRTNLDAFGSYSHTHFQQAVHNKFGELPESQIVTLRAFADDEAREEKQARDGMLARLRSG